MSIGSRRTVATVAALALGAAAPAASPAALGKGISAQSAGRVAAVHHEPSGVVPNRVIVRFEARVGRAAQRGVVQRLGARLEPLPEPGLAVVEVPRDAGSARSVRRLAALPGVLHAEPDQFIEFRAVPSDPLFGRQWALRNSGQTVLAVKGRPGADIAATSAWDLDVGSPSVIVADVDTGADLSHPDLAANIWVNPAEVPGNHIDDDGNGLTDDVNGWDWADSDNVPDDSRSFDQGHGTETSSVIGAVGNNGIGIAGVNWRVSLMPLRAATLSDTISAFVYARQQGARILNFSAGFPFYSQALKDTIDNLGTMLIVNAADNGGFNGRGDNSDRVADFPCKFPSLNLICVAASNQRDELTGFSNFGPTSVDLAAPGRNVLGAYPPNALSFDLSEFFDEPIGNRIRHGGRRDHWGLTQKLGGSLTDSKRGDYENNTNSFVVTRPADLRQRSACEVDFFLRHQLEEGRDRFFVEVSRAPRHWRRIGSFSGLAKGDFHFLRLPKRFNGAHRVRVRFRLHTDGSVRRDGVYLDDLQVTCITTAPTYAFADGTSFAAPQVAGAAALIFARYPASTVAEVKARLINGVDRLPSMAGKLVSGGRLDVNGALR
jgi:subtilisin family serine protease